MGEFKEKSIPEEVDRDAMEDFIRAMEPTAADLDAMQRDMALGYVKELNFLITEMIDRVRYYGETPTVSKLELLRDATADLERTLG